MKRSICKIKLNKNRANKRGIKKIIEKKSIKRITNYFNENSRYAQNIFLVENQGGEYIHFLCVLIQVENLEKMYYSFNHNSSYYLNYTSYIEFKGDIEFMNVSYVVFNVKFTNADFQTNLYYDFNILYRNEDDWIFSKLK